MSRMLKYFLLLLTFFVVGCGGSDTSGASTVPVTPTTGTVVVRHTLQRAVPPDVTEFRFFGLDADGQVAFGPEARPKAREVRVDVPASMRRFIIQYFNDQKLVGSFDTDLAVEPGNEAVVEDPASDYQVVVAPHSVVILPGASGPMQALVNGQPVSATWTSSNSGVTVNEQGQITAGGTGSGTITATTPQGTGTGFFFVLTPPFQGSFQMSQSTLSLVTQSSGTLELIVNDISQFFGATWSTSNPEVAFVDQNGKVTAGFGGTATITATSGAATATCNVFVSESELVSLELVPNPIQVSFGGTTYLYARGTYADGGVYDVTDQVSWGVVDGGDYLGFGEANDLQGLSPGSGHVTCTLNGISAPPVQATCE